ncbi:hypothetical protein [Streptomyces griseorubiginosus]|uniref:hypothetical protein n=1 Tax=Streptomyces griseorubiginosus TaxID=67304 RepID=UPI0036E6160F
MASAARPSGPRGIDGTRIQARRTDGTPIRALAALGGRVSVGDGDLAVHAAEGCRNLAVSIPAGAAAPVGVR